MVMTDVLRSDALTQENFKEARELVIKGTEAFPASLEDLRKKAKWMAFHRSGEVLVGVGGLKDPKPEYRDKLFEKTRSSHDPERFVTELGWIFVEESSRGKGVAKGIVTELLQRAPEGGLFSVVRADNEKGIALLKGFGFKKTGTEIPSTRGDHSFNLFVRE